MIQETESATPLAPIMIVGEWVWLRKSIVEFQDDETGQPMWKALELSYRMEADEEPPTEKTFNRAWLRHSEDNSLQAQIDDLNAAIIEIGGLL